MTEKIVNVTSIWTYIDRTKKELRVGNRVIYNIDAILYIVLLVCEVNT